MPTWGEIVGQIAQLKTVDGQDHFDEVRRRYLLQLSRHTGRSVILYATNWTQAHKVSNPETLLINDADLQGLMEVIHGVERNGLDIVLHSPGGSPEAVESFVDYIRGMFDNIRVIIPQAAMSAATMLACAADSIVMGKHSSLGPIDPQIIINTKTETKMIPAQTIVNQFFYAQDEAEKRPESFQAWLPLLRQYGPGLLLQCMNAMDLAKELVSEWLNSYMFARLENRNEIADNVAEYLSTHDNFKSHARHISRKKAKKLGLIVEDLEEDQTLQDLVLSVFHATTITFDGTETVKIIENHLGKSYIRVQNINQPDV